MVQIITHGQLKFVYFAQKFWKVQKEGDTTFILLYWSKNNIGQLNENPFLYINQDSTISYTWKNSKMYDMTCCSSSYYSPMIDANIYLSTSLSIYLSIYLSVYLIELDY